MLEVIRFETGHVVLPLVHDPLVARREGSDTTKKIHGLRGGGGGTLRHLSHSRDPRSGPHPPTTFCFSPSTLVSMLPQATAPTGRALLRRAVAGTASVYVSECTDSKGTSMYVVYTSWEISALYPHDQTFPLTANTARHLSVSSPAPNNVDFHSSARTS